MYDKISKTKYRWLIMLLIGCWLMAGVFVYGQYLGDDEEAGPRVILYKHADFEGQRLVVKAGYNIKDLKKKGWNDRISSIELVDNVKIKIYEHKNYQGASVTITGDILDLAHFSEGIHGTWNDKISSIKVYHTRRYYGPKYRDEEEMVHLIFYKHANRRGSSLEGETGYHSKISRRWNDIISSLWIRRGYQVTLYEHGKFRGRRLVLKGRGWKGSVYNLDSYGFNDIVSSYKLKRIR